MECWFDLASIDSHVPLSNDAAEENSAISVDLEGQIKIDASVGMLFFNGEDQAFETLGGLGGRWLLFDDLV